MPIGDYLTKIFGGPFRKETDMGDGSHAQTVIAAPPADLVAGDRLKVDIGAATVTVDQPMDVHVTNQPTVNVAGTVPVSGTVAVSGTVPVSVTGQPLAVTLPANPLPVSGTVAVSGVGGTVAVSVSNTPAVTLSGQPIAITHPANLVTGSGAIPKPRLRVDPGQTGFFEGRMFRSFFNSVIPKAGPAVQFRFTSPINFILWTQELELTQGALQLEIYTGAIPSGTWVSVPVIGLNRMSEVPLPTYVSAVTIETSVGGTGNFTGGTRVDLLQVRTSSTNGTASNVGNNFSERGLPAAVFYGRLSTLAGGLTVNDDAQYKYSLAWEERP